MAVILRCSSFFTRPNRLRSPPPDHLSGQPRLEGKLDSLLFEVDKFASSFGNVSNARKCIFRQCNCNKSECSQCITKIQPLSDYVSEDLSAHQVRW